MTEKLNYLEILTQYAVELSLKNISLSHAAQVARMLNEMNEPLTFENIVKTYEGLNEYFDHLETQFLSDTKKGN